MGAGILSTIRQIGAVMGLSVLGAVLQTQLVSNVTSAINQISTLPAAVRSQIIAGVSGGNLSYGGMNVPANLPAAATAQLMDLFKTQFAHSLDSAMRVGIIVILLGAIASLFIAGNIKKAKTPPIA